MDSLSYSVVHFAKPTASEREVFEAASVAIGERVHSLDMEQTISGGNNCAPVDMPKQFHAVHGTKGRGTSLFNVCPERPGALDYLVSNHKEYLGRTQKLPITGWIYWPFDEGGCNCEKCTPWGGTGANPLPARFERLYRQCQKIAKGFELYSEGIFEDVNKMVVNGMYIDPKRTANDVLADYARYELPGCDPSDFVALCAKLENIYETDHIIVYLTYGDPKELERRLAVAREARSLAEKIDLSILPTMRRCWRWRQLYLRALIDEAIYATRDVRTPSVIPAYKELAALYHAERQVTGLYNGNWEGWTCPPLADSPGARKEKARRAKKR